MGELVLGLAEQLLVIRNIEDRNAKRTPCGLELLLAARPPHAMSPDQDRTLCFSDQIQKWRQRGWIGPCAGNRACSADERTFLPSSILVERREHDVDRQADVDGAWIAAGRDLPGTINDLRDACPVGNADAGLGERSRNRYVVDFFVTT